MKSTIIFHLLLVTIFFSSRLLTAQEVSEKTFKNAFTFNITRLALMEARFGYERYITPRVILTGNVGVKFSTSSESFKNVSAILVYVPFYFPVTKGIYTSLGCKYLLSEKSKFYLCPEIYFNHIYYNDKYYLFGVGTDMDSYISLESMRLDKTGLKFTVGRKIALSSKNTRWEFDVFGGVGIYYRAEILTIYAKQNGIYHIDDFQHPQVYDPPKEEKTNYFTPALHGGLLISFAF